MSDGNDAPLYAFRHNVVVSASAGTGKTFRLVTLYALLALGLTSRGASSDDVAGPPVLPTRIAATTFSRAAAAEIRERVERLLRAIASGADDAQMSAYFGILVARAAETGSPSPRSRIMRERAARALAELPHALIDTLHGLAGRVVRRSALELGMSPGFVVLDQEQARATTDAAIERVLTAALRAGDRAAVHLLDAAGGLGLARQKMADLLDRADEEGLALGELACADFVAQARESAAQLADVCRALIAEGSKTFAEPAEEVARAVEGWSLHGRLPDGAGPALERLFCGRARAKPLPSESALVALRDGVRGDNLPHRARRLAAFLDAAHELTPRTAAVRALLARIADERAGARLQVSSLGFGDLLRTARDALRDRLDLSESARAMWDVLLVDEFQDTSRVQRDLVYLLRELALSARKRPPGVLPGAEDLVPSGLLIVGDRKQSIYGFRGADVTVFSRVAVDLAGEPARRALALGADFASSGPPNAAFVSLAENRRSVPSVLTFVNAFAAEDFSTSSPRPFDITYAESEHLRAVTGLSTPASAASVVMVDDSGEQPLEAPPIVRTATGAMREALVVAGLIVNEVRASDGALRFGDFAVLARRRSTLPLLEFALARLEVPYLVAGRGLYDTREVRDLFAVLRVVVDPLDRDALAVTMRGPALALRDASLARLARPGSGLSLADEWFRGSPALADALPIDERQRLVTFHGRMNALARIAVGLGPADALRLALRELGIDQVMAALPRASQRFANVERLIAIASARGGSVPSFVRWLDRQIADDTDESEAAVLSLDDDAVSLMTIHASKGLEFRAVALVDLGAAPRTTPVTLAIRPGDARREPTLVVRHTQPEGPSLHTPETIAFGRESLARDLAERKRLTYVAMTRARERLYVVAPPGPPQGSAAATLRAMVEGGRLPELAVVPAGPLLLTTAEPSPSRTAAVGLAQSQAAPRSSVPESGGLSISTTPLVTFDQCPRRYRLVHELAQEAPLAFVETSAVASKPSARTRQPTLDPRVAGSAAHRVLETLPLALWGAAVPRDELVARLAAEGLGRDRPETVELAGQLATFLGGAYAMHVRERATAVRREEPFVVTIGCAPGLLSLRGTIDLLVFYEDGSADVVDYKSSWSDSADVPFQLRAYALAARRRFGATAVRAAIVNLSAPDAMQLVRIDDADLAAFELRLTLLRSRFVQCRTRDDFPGVEIARCRELRCGFVAACHATARGAGPEAPSPINAG